MAFGDATVLGCDSDGEARASFVAPPPLPGAPPPPCDAEDKAAAEDADGRLLADCMVLDLTEANN